MNLERYKIETASDNICIEVDQKKNALINALIGFALFGFAGHAVYIQGKDLTLYRKGRVPFPWTVKLVDREGNEFKREFKFQKEKNARRLSEILSEYYGVDVKLLER